MKEFWTYTALRALLFAATFGLVGGVWAIVAGSPNWLVVVVVAMLLSGLGSYVLLQGPRTAFAARVEERASRAVARVEQARAKEDVD